MNHTTNYNLNQWEAEDVIKREDFNADNAAIDAAIKAAATAASSAQSAANGACKITTGSYTGKGKYGSANQNTLTFPFEPKLVIIYYRPVYGLATGDSTTELALLMRPATSFKRKFSDGSTGSLFLTWSGNTLSWYGPDSFQQLNLENWTYAYIALG